MSRYELVSADSHVLEPPDLWTRYLPAKFHIRFLPPVPTDAMGDEPWQDKALVQTVADEVRDTIQEHVLDMVARRTSVWL